MALRARAGKGPTTEAAPATATPQQQGAERTDIADAAASTRRPRAVAAAAEVSAQRLARQEQARDERAREQLRQQQRHEGPPATGDFPVVPLGTIANIAVHSVLMLALPLGLYYAAIQGALDPVFAPAFGAVRRENRPLLGGVLAVLGVNGVIVSFLVRAFAEPTGPPAPAAAAAARSRKRD